MLSFESTWWTLNICRFMPLQLNNVSDFHFNYITLLKLCIFMLFLLLFSCSVMSNSLRPRELQHAWLPCPSLSPGAYSNSCPLSQSCHPAILSSVVPFSSCLLFFPALGCFSISQLFVSCGQSIVASVSASALPMNIQDWVPLGWTGLISIKSKRFPRVFSNTTVWKHQFFNVYSLWYNSHIHTWLLKKP